MVRFLILFFICVGLLPGYVRRKFGDFSGNRVYSISSSSQPTKAFHYNLFANARTRWSNDAVANAIARGDYYIDVKRARLLGRDGASTTDIRIIDKDLFDSINREYSGTSSMEATKELQRKSSVVTFDREKIQQDVIAINKKTQETRKENQTIIFLEINDTAEIPTGRVTSCIEVEGDNSSSGILLQQNPDPTRDGTTYFRGLPNIFLGQIHCHPMKESQFEEAGSGVSSKDQVAAKKFGGNIYALESFQGGDDVPIDKITPGGKTTDGLSTILQRFDFGLDALMYVSEIKLEK